MTEGQTSRSGNTEEDWAIFEVLCKDSEMDTVDDIDITTSLKSEIAGLQFKRERLTEELNEMKCQLRTRENRCVELQVEADQLREQTARQNSVIASLKKRVNDLEEKERGMHAVQGRSEIAIQTLQRDNKYQEDKLKEFEKKTRHLEMELSEEEQKKECARNNLQELVRRLSVALGFDCFDAPHLLGEALIHKASDLVQEASRVKNKSVNVSDNLAAVDLELRSCRESLERTIQDKECLQRQSANQLMEIDRLRQEKEAIEMHHRVAERELNDLKEKLSASNRSLGNASGSIAQQESQICQLRDELKVRDEKLQRLQHEYRHFLEAISILLSTPSRFVEVCESVLKDRIRDVMAENNEKGMQLDALREKLNLEGQQLSRQMSSCEQSNSKLRMVEEEKACLESRLHKIEAEVNACEMSREGLKRDKSTFMCFLERLARALNMEEISTECGVELHTESLLLRAEQLARLESDKLVDKTALVYQLQRRVRTLREQLQRKDLHLDLLRRKLSLQEDNAKTRCILQSERDEANCRVKKLLKQVEKLQMQLADAKSQCRDLNTQLAEAADYKISALERARKIEDLQKRLIESEALRTKYNRKVTMLKDQVRSTGDTIEQERHISEHSMHLLRDELVRLKDNLSELSRRETQLQSFKGSIAKILGVGLPIADYELISRLQKLVDAHHDFTLVSRRYDDPVLRLTARSPTGGSRCTRTPDRSRYDDSGYTDAADIDDIECDLFKCKPR